MRTGLRDSFRVDSRATPGKLHTEERTMKYTVFCACAWFAFGVAATPAQTNMSLSGKCGKPDVQQNIPAGDSPSHVFVLAQGKCETKGEVGGAASKEGAFS